MPIKWVLIGLAVIAIGFGAYFGWRHYEGLLTKIEILAGVNAKLETAVAVEKANVATAKANIEDWKRSAEQHKQALEKLTSVISDASAETRRLNDVLAKHDLDRLVAAKPGLVETRINAGSAAAADRLRGASRPAQVGGNPGTGTPAPRPTASPPGSR